MNSKLTGEGEEAVKKKALTFLPRNSDFCARHENKSCSACRELASFAKISSDLRTFLC